MSVQSNPQTFLPSPIPPGPPTPEIDPHRMRQYRLDRVRAEMRSRDLGALVLFDPVNIRYATDCRNMQIWTMRNPARYCVVVADGPVVMFEIGGRAQPAEDLGTIDEVRFARPWFFYYAGRDTAGHARTWAAELHEILVEHHGTRMGRIAVDRCDADGVRALEACGLDVFDAQEPMEQARRIKSQDEIAAIRVAIDVCEIGIARMRAALQPGITELALWSILHQANIEHDGEYIETRLLSSGRRTNPWYQEASDKIIEAGEIVSFDCDLIGPRGYGADLSRAFLCGERQASEEQRNLYRRAHEQVQRNTELLCVGRSFREIVERAMPLPDDYYPFHRVAHGNGMSTGEFPAIGGRPGQPHEPIHDGVLEAGMVLCVGSYVGRRRGGEGVKLEHQLVLRDTGPELLSSPLFESAFMAP